MRQATQERALWGIDSLTEAGGRNIWELSMDLSGCRTAFGGRRYLGDQCWAGQGQVAF